jgi:2-polyprenyl-3-methyl-5-hydroxy-6-metoxy-1,4-benzoquinol methylase
MSTVVRVRERKLTREQLDDAPDAVAQSNLADIARINRLTGARWKLVRMLKRRYAPDAAFRFLDVGAASGDVAAAVREAFPNATTICLDLMKRNLERAEGHRLQADAFELPVAPASVDVVHCSLFFHHFQTEECAAILGQMARASRNLILIQDLHRTWIAYWFLPLTKWLFRWEELTIADGQASVAAAWRRNELEHLLNLTKLSTNSQIEWHFPSFRFFIAISKKS